MSKETGNAVIIAHRKGLVNNSLLYFSSLISSSCDIKPMKIDVTKPFPDDLDLGQIDVIMAADLAYDDTITDGLIQVISKCTV